jgi:hypothetical protein
MMQSLLGNIFGPELLRLSLMYSLRYPSGIYIYFFFSREW